MKTLKIMSVIGIVWSVLSFVCLVAFDNSIDYESAVGWGILAAGYLLAFAIVCLVQATKK